MSFRIDQNWGENNRFWFSYNDRDLEALNGTPVLPVPLDQNFFRKRVSHYLRFGWDDVISATMGNHFTVGFNRLNDPSKGVAVTGEDWPVVLGISGAHGPGFPRIRLRRKPAGNWVSGLRWRQFRQRHPQ